MSAEPKHVFDYTEWDTGISKCRHPSHIAGYSATCWEASANKAGWVSPEEATAREAAARREALLEAADDLEPLVANQHPTASLNPEVWLRDRAFEMDEPERDKEGGND